MKEAEIENIKKQSVVGVMALTSRSFVLQAINFGAMFMLTIFLAPEVFGIFFVVTAVVNFLNYFSDIGLAAALIQKKEEVTSKDLKTTFAIQQALVLFLVLVSLILSTQIAFFYGLRGNGLGLLRALIISFFLSSLKTIPSILLERKLEFNRLIIPQIGETLAFNLVAVILAWQGWGISSFTWAVLARGLIGLILIYIVSPWRPGFAFHRQSAKSLLSFGVPFQANSLLALVKDDLLTVFLARFIPFSQLGFIGWAKKWANMPLRFIMDNVTKVTFPAYSRFQDNPHALRLGIERALFAVCFLTFPILIGLVILAAPLVEYLPRYLKWQPALISLYLFGLQAAFACVSTTLVNALNATGRIKITLKLMTFWTVLTWILTSILVLNWGFNGVALAAVLVASTVALPIVLVKKITDYSLLDNVAKPLIGAFLMGLGLLFLGPRLIINLQTTVLAVFLGAMIYLGLMFILAKQKIIEATQLVFSSIKK